ncbi:MAG TPA: nucleoside deaminase [Nevskiaceae bacterium]
MVTREDIIRLRRCIELAEEALAAGNPPFGALLADADGKVLHEERNQITSGDLTLHPELALARWASMHLDATRRAAATVYTSDEHCPMCAGAHGWAGLGRIVYAVSAAELTRWYVEWGIHRSNVRTVPIHNILEGTTVDGPVPELADAVRELQRRFFMPSGHPTAPG